MATRPSKRLGRVPDLGMRSSGVLLHPTSLPGKLGYGDLGSAAYRFVDFLAQAGQRWWQVLPLNPPDMTGSPYYSRSAFAGSRLLISLEGLVQDGLLKQSALRSGRRAQQRQLQRAFEYFCEKRPKRWVKAFEKFCHAQRTWLDDYALFSTLKLAHQGKSWVRWQSAARRHTQAALTHCRRRWGTVYGLHRFEQFVFYRQWQQLKDYAARRGIGLIGDIPFYIAHDSADVWAHQDLFKLDSTGHMLAVAGAPPDGFSRNGQRWGNPLYRWPAMRATQYAWWVDRLRKALLLFDAVRLDHFIGFYRCWEVPAHAKTALRGRFVAGPRDRFFEILQKRLGTLPLIAEDLGRVIPEVYHLRDRFNLPGMRVLQFGFSVSQGSQYHCPYSFDKRCVVYTGTHDNDTIKGWLSTLTQSKVRDRKRKMKRKTLLRNLRDYLGGISSAFHWQMIRLAMYSIANVTIFPMQDVLGLSSVARMNYPGTTQGNWKWRMSQQALSGAWVKQLYDLTQGCDRNQMEA